MYNKCKMETDTKIFFWKENNKYGFLSNFYYSSFKDSLGFTYICNEQYFMAQKCLLFDSENKKLFKEIMECKIPITIKKLGRKVNNFDQHIWDKEKYNIMKTGVKYKFSQNKFLKKKLLETKDKLLFEASPYDKIWGIGIDHNEASKLPITDFKGENLLGKSLMEVRSELKN